MSELGIDLIKLFGQGLARKKVGIIEFCESDEFCNVPLYPRQRLLLKLLWLEELDGYEEDVLTEWINSSDRGGEVLITPKIRERIAVLREQAYPHFNTVQLVQGRRSGKGYTTGASIAKKIYDLVQLEDPSQFYGVAKGENIYFTIVADSQDQAKKYQFKDAKNWLLGCEPLQEFLGEPLAESLPVYTPADLRRIDTLRAKKVQTGRHLASLRVEAFAKNARTIRGNASIMLIFDEMAHITPGESHISDEQLFIAAEPSLIQFSRNAMLFANSSPYQKTGKFYDLYLQTQDLLEDGSPAYPSMFMIQSPSWEMYRDWERDHRFKSAIAVSPDWDISIPGVMEMKQKERSNPESFKVEFRAQFADVIDAFLVPDLVERMFDPQVTFATLGRYLAPKHSGTIEHIYKAHGDPSSTGANFGFAIGHVEYVDEVDTISGAMKEHVPHVVFDLIEAFYPEDFPNHTIDWLEIMPVFADYINLFRPYEFSFDQFNSMAPIQMLQAEADRLGAWETQISYKPGTPTLNRQRAMNFKTALNLGRIHAPHPATNNGIRNSIDLGRLELRFLQEKNGRVEKQDMGPIQTKDIADCIMEVVDALIGQSIMEEFNMLNTGPSFGAHGGYSLGSRTSGDDPFGNFYGDRRIVSHTPNPARGRNPRRR
jgi:hypothetical protein